MVRSFEKFLINDGINNMKKLIAIFLLAGTFAAHATNNFNTLDTAPSVSVSGALPTGTNVIGKVGIDQTTPGTTNKVDIGTNGVVTSTSTGNVASGATDSGNPIKIGGVFNSTLPTLTTGQRGDVQLNTKGVMRVSLTSDSSGTAIAAEVVNADAAAATSVGSVASSYGRGLNSSGTWDRIRSGVITPTATLTGHQNSLPWAIYNATPTARTEGQGGPLQADVDGKLQVVAKATPGTMTDRSGTITSGGTAQTIMAANANRKYLLIQNSSDTAMWCNFTTTAVASQPSFTLIAGASFVMENNAISTEAISCIGATTGKIFTAKEM